MAGALVSIDVGPARAEARRLIANARQPRRILNAIGIFAEAEAKKSFGRRGPGWAPTHPYFAELKARTRGGDKGPLRFFGALERSIVHDVPDNNRVRVGSTLRYAATHQYGDPNERSFYIYLIPEMEQGQNGMRIKRNAYGFALGRVVLKQATSDAPYTHGAAFGKGRKLSEASSGKVVRQLIRLKSVRPRPFLRYPTPQDWSMILTIIRKSLFSEGQSTGAAPVPPAPTGGNA